MSWKEWIQNKQASEILEAQVPHNVTYWIRHYTICENRDKCSHYDSYLENLPLELTQKGIPHFGHGYCFDCYMDLGLGSGVKIVGNNK